MKSFKKKIIVLIWTDANGLINTSTPAYTLITSAEWKYITVKEEH